MTGRCEVSRNKKGGATPASSGTVLVYRSVLLATFLVSNLLRGRLRDAFSAKVSTEEGEKDLMSKNTDQFVPDLDAVTLRVEVRE